jgi:hypothetical protein
MNVERALRLMRQDFDPADFNPGEPQYPDEFDPDNFDDGVDDDDPDDDRGGCSDCPDGQCPYDDPYYLD